MASIGVRQLFLPVLLLSFLQASFAVPFEVKDGNKSCIMADLSVDFSVRFNATGSKEEVRNFELPVDAKLHSSSTCRNENGSAPLLAVVFGAGHILSMSFNKTTKEYSVLQLAFAYNLSDSAVFQNSTRNGTVEVVSKKTDIFASLNTTYRCNSVDQIVMEHVNVSLHNIKIEAYLPFNNFSAKESVCRKDVTPTAAPTANSTTGRPTTPAPPVPPTPAVGTYNVTEGNRTCLLISAGLQLNITYKSKLNKTQMDVSDLDPLHTNHTGHCKPSPTITFSTTLTTLSLTFVENSTSKVFYLGSVAVKATLPSDAQALDFSTNETTFYLKATVGNSYKCKSKQTLMISKEFSINTFNLQVQAFNITGGKFGAVEECQQDENSMLVPIIVGAALAGLVLIVLVAYLIGRKRSHAGYQTI